MMRTIVGIGATALTISLVAAGASAQEWNTPVWPGERWAVSTPEEQGIDSGGLVRAMEAIAEKKPPIHSLTIIRHGRMVLDAAFWPYDGASLHDLASVTKSVTSALVGAAVNRGCLSGVDQSVIECFPCAGAASLDRRKLDLTLEHLLTMTNGLHGPEPKEDTLIRMVGSPDWTRFMLDLPMVEEPGKQFAYSSGGVHLLSGVIREATGTTALDFGRTTLFDPIGMGTAVWPADRAGNNYGWGDLRLHPHDMARFGYLYLRGGMWNRRQVLPEDWVVASTKAQVALPADASGMERGYGYLWWVFPGFYTASGRGGQRILVWPERDMVVVTTGGGFDSAELLLKFVAPAVADRPLPPNPAVAEKLRSLLASAKEAPRPESPYPSSPLAGKISGARYSLESNWPQWSDFTLTFDQPGQARLRMTWFGSTIEVPVGLDGAWRIGPGRHNIPAAARGGWESERRFSLDLNEAGNINTWRMAFDFSGEGVSVQAAEATGLPGFTVRGKPAGKQ